MAGIAGMEGREVGAAVALLDVDISDNGFGRVSGVGVSGWSLRIAERVSVCVSRLEGRELWEGTHKLLSGLGLLLCIWCVWVGERREERERRGLVGEFGRPLFLWVKFVLFVSRCRWALRDKDNARRVN